MQLRWQSIRLACEGYRDRYPASPFLKQGNFCCKFKTNCTTIHVKAAYVLDFTDRDRTRTCNFRIRSPRPYPLGHTTILTCFSFKSYIAFAKITFTIYLGFFFKKMDKLCAILTAKIWLHRPGIEPGPPTWQASILPLNHRCLLTKEILCSTVALFLEKVQQNNLN